MLNALQQKVDVGLCNKLIELSDAMLAKVKLMPEDSRDAWNHEIIASKERIAEMKGLFEADPARETTHKDRCVVMMHFSLANQFTNILREEGEKRHADNPQGTG